MIDEKLNDDLMIALRLHYQLGDTLCQGIHVAFKAIVPDHQSGSLHVIECGEISVTDRVFLSKASIILLSLLLGDERQIRFFRWRHYIERVAIDHSITLSHGSLMVETDSHVAVFAKRYLFESIHTIIRSPCHHIAFAGCEECLTCGISVFCHYRAEFSIIINLEIHFRPFHWFVVRIHDSEVDAGSLSVVAYEIYLSVIGSSQQYFLWTTIITECLGVHQ